MKHKINMSEEHITETGGAQEERIILGIAGPKLAGKGTAVEYLNTTQGFVNFTMSDILVDVLARLGKNNSRVNIIALVGALRDAFGENILAKVLCEDIEKSDKQRIIIDGIRMNSEVDMFQELPGFKLMYMDAPLEDRYERAINRGEKAGESEMSFEEFKAEEQARSELQIKSLKDRADFVMFNKQSEEEMRAELDNIISNL